VSDFVLDASLTLQWFLEDEADRKYSLAVLASLSEKRALVPLLWFYEVGNGLLMACRRKRISPAIHDGIVPPQISQLPVKSFVGFVLLEGKLLLTQLLKLLGDHGPSVLSLPTRVRVRFRPCHTKIQHKLNCASLNAVQYS
jgi:hypothetical protein